MNESFLLWGFGLLALAVLLFFIEVFLPSGGVIGLFVGVSAIAAVVFFFKASTMWGLSSILFLLVMTPLMISFALKIWPNTPIGRRLILGSPTPDDELDEPEPSDPLLELIGATGVVATDLHPVGLVLIEGERIEAIAQTGVIRAGQQVRITEIVDGRIKVRLVE